MRQRIQLHWICIWLLGRSSVFKFMSIVNKLVIILTVFGHWKWPKPAPQSWRPTRQSSADSRFSLHYTTEWATSVLVVSQQYSKRCLVWLRQTSQGHKNVLSMIMVMGSNPSQVEFGMRSTSVYIALEPKIKIKITLSSLCQSTVWSNKSTNYYLSIRARGITFE